jgi:hypothetical protein
MGFAIAVHNSKPIASIKFNDVNIAAHTLAPTAAIIFNPSAGFIIAAVASAPVANIIFDKYFTITAKASAPVTNLAFNSVTLFAIAAKTKAPIAQLQMGQAWVINALASAPIANIIFVGSSLPFNIAARVSAPIAEIIFNNNLAVNIVMAMNLKNKLVSFYENYNFNSACQLLADGKCLACGSDGIYLLDGDDDNGEEIDAFVDLVSSDFGVSNIKMIPELQINFSGNGPLQVSAAIDQDTEFDDPDTEIMGPYPTPSPQGNKISTKKVTLPKGKEGGHWQFKIGNTNGSTFNIREITIPVSISRKRMN